MSVGRQPNAAGESDVVWLRKLSAAPDAERLGRALRVRHPRVISLLGLSEADGQVCLTSTYVASVSLLELVRACETGGRALAPNILARVALDAVVIWGELDGGGGATAEQPACLFEDTIWITARGVVHLSEVGVGGARQPEPSSGAAAGGDLRRLVALLERQLPSGGRDAEALREALQGSAAGGPVGAARLKAALAPMAASESEVAEALQCLCGPALIERQTFLIDQHGASFGDEDTALFGYSDEVTYLHPASGPPVTPRQLPNRNGPERRPTSPPTMRRREPVKGAARPEVALPAPSLPPPPPPVEVGAAAELLRSELAGDRPSPPPPFGSPSPRAGDPPPLEEAPPPALPPLPWHDAPSTGSPSVLPLERAHQEARWVSAVVGAVALLLLLLWLV